MPLWNPTIRAVARTGTDSTNNKVQLIVRSAEIGPLRASEYMFINYTEPRGTGCQHLTDARSTLRSLHARVGSQHQTAVPWVEPRQLDDGQARQVDPLQVKTPALWQVKELKAWRWDWERHSTMTTGYPHLQWTLMYKCWTLYIKRIIDLFEYALYKFTLYLPTYLLTLQETHLRATQQHLPLQCHQDS